MTSRLHELLHGLWKAPSSYEVRFQLERGIIRPSMGTLFTQWLICDYTYI